jgi:hypothetical protein
MTLFTIDNDGKFSEFNENKNESKGRELDLFSLVGNNPSSVAKDTEIFLVGKNVSTDSGQIIDFLGLDRFGNTIIIDIEEKKASRKTLFRIIEKAAYIESLDYNDLSALFYEFVGKSSDLGKIHADFFKVDDDSFQWNKHSSLVIVSENIATELGKTSSYLRKNGLDISCVLFKSISYGDGIKMVSREFVTGDDEFVQKTVTETVDRPKSKKDVFFQSLDENGRFVFSQLFDFAEKTGLKFKWTSQGFSLNVMVSDETVGLCYGYAQNSLLSQSIYTGFDQILKKVNNAEDIVTGFQNQIENIGFFNKTRSSYRWEITEQYSAEEITNFFNILKETSDKIRDNGLIGIEAGSFPVEA